MSSAKIDGRRHEGCSAVSVNNFITSGSTGRKRKSRWDQDEWVRRDGTRVHHQDLKSQCPIQSDISRLQEGSEVASSSLITMNAKDNMISSKSSNMDEDLPPGFSAPCQDPIKANLCSQIFTWTPDPSEVVQGHPQRKYISRSPISYSIPVSTFDQNMTSQNGTIDDWEISPSLPFHPFPPLPLYPRTTITPGSSSESPQGYNSRLPNASASLMTDSHINRHYSQKRSRESTDGLENTFFRQKKLITPPWMRRRQGNLSQRHDMQRRC